MVAQTDGLAVAAVDGDSPAAGGGMRVGDSVVQVNGAVPRTCAEYARVVRDARRDGKALLVLVRRDAGEIPLVVAASAWQRPPPAVALAPPPPAEAPSVRTLVASPPPLPLPLETHVTLEEVMRGLGELVPAGRAPARLESYDRGLVNLHRQVETLARGTAGDVVTGLRTVLHYYDAAGVAWASAEALRERDRRPRHVPANVAAAAPFFEDSPVASAIEEFPFLRATVVRDPSPGVVVGERAGLWRPLEARALLWERGQEELRQLTGWLKRPETSSRVGAERESVARWDRAGGVPRAAKPPRQTFRMLRA